MHYIQQLMDKKMVLLPEQLPGLIFGSHNSLLPSFPGSESPEPVIRPTIQAIRELLTTIDNIQHHQCARDENLRPSSYQNTGDSTHSNNSIEDNHCSISADEKIKFNLFFEKLDADGDGYIDGDVCFKFFSNSKLSQNILAQIWDLADITKSGSLSKEEFAIAMKLINNKNRYNVSPPANLPLSMVPPSLRKQVANIQPKSPQTIISNYSDEVRKASYRDQFKSPELFDLLDNIFIPRKTSDPQILNDQTNGHDIATLNNLRTIYNNQQQNHISLENKLNTEERAIQDLQTERARWETEYRHLKELNDMMEQRLNNLKTQKDLESKAIDNLKGSVTKMESELTLLRSALSMTMQELTITQSNKTSFLTALSKGQEESQELKVTFQKNRNEIAQLHQDLEAKIKLLGLEPRDVLGDMTVNTPINVNTWNNLTVRGPQLDTTGTSASSQTRSPQYREPEPVQKVRAPQDYGNSEVDSPLAQFQPWNILAHQESLNRG
ncbi:hypothetical protein FBU30_008363 [Linnemannia zychae]|nr:hypothetical protein FBU30_008363 [Linnemannia zychae]